MEILFIVSLMWFFVSCGLCIYSCTTRWFRTHRPWHPLGIVFIVSMWVSGVFVIITAQSLGL